MNKVFRQQVSERNYLVTNMARLVINMRRLSPRRQQTITKTTRTNSEEGWMEGWREGRMGGREGWTGGWMLLQVTEELLCKTCNKPVSRSNLLERRSRRRMKLILQ